MQKRSLGAKGPTLSAMGLGCMMFTESFGPGDDEAESLRIIEAAFDAGVTFFNTGDFYGMGRNELLLGKALRGRRDQAFISVKFGALRDPRGMYYGLDTRPHLVKAYLTHTLHRLGTDYVDLYQPSRLHPQVPIEETVGAIKELITAGYVRHLGLSEMGAATVRRAHAVHPVTALEYEYSIGCREIEGEILPVLRELGIGLVAYGTLTHGLLGGGIRSRADLNPREGRAHFPQFQGENLQRNLQLVAAFSEFARARGVSPAQIAIAWVLAREPLAVPVVGARRLASWRDSLGALGVQLTAADLEELERIVPRGALAGTRYPAEQMAIVGR